MANMLNEIQSAQAILEVASMYPTNYGWSIAGGIISTSHFDVELSNVSVYDAVNWYQCIHTIGSTRTDLRYPL